MEKPSKDQKKKNEEIVEEILREYSQASGNRGNFESHWQEVAERCYPSYSGSFNSNSSLQSQGEKKTELVFDSTAAIALGRFAAILDSMLTPRNQTWHRIRASDPYLEKQRPVMLWFEEVNRLLFKYRYAPKANFTSQNYMDYKSLGAFGTGALFIDELKGRNERGIRYKSIHLGEIYFFENHQGIIDKALRHFPLSARQALQMWGDDCPENIREAYGRTPDRQFYFIHCVKPRSDYDPERVDGKGLPFGSYYIAVEGKKLVSEGGYTSFPYAISRYEQAVGEVYGRSPAMDVLPAIKTLNEEKKTVLKQGQKTVDPVLLTHDDGVVDGFSLKAGAINSGGVSKDGRLLVQALPVGNIAVGKDLMDDERAVINDSFLINLFQILIDTPQMSATEVMERTKEKGILLAPSLGRQQSERLGPMIDRELDVLSLQGLLPPMPEVLREAQGTYRLEYDSPLTRSQKAEEASGIMRTVETALAVVNVTQNPEPLDFFEWDTIIPEIAAIQGVPSKWMRDMKKVQEIRAGRQKQAETETAIQGAPAAAAMMKAAAVTQKSK